jgi:hypothetical protein
MHLAERDTIHIHIIDLGIQRNNSDSSLGLLWNGNSFVVHGRWSLMDIKQYSFVNRDDVECFLLNYGIFVAPSKSEHSQVQ